ncbi:hypothetical protein DRQ29_07510 [bacterium]|nr:MAG: hypothetical protein DRQ29_07510 [bacterium]
MDRENIKFPGAPHFGLFIVYASLITIGVFLIENAFRFDLTNTWDVVRFFLPFLLLISFGFYLWKKQREINNTLYLFSITDPLTGAFNYLALFQKIDNFLENDADFTLIFIDIDGFKKYNDNKGHIAGNEALVEFVRIAREIIGENNIVARFGGDEFVIILKDIDDEPANVIQKIAEKFNLTTGLKISYGITKPRKGDTESTLIHRADSQMYKNKRKI